MGRRYSFELFYPATGVEAGLRELDHFQPTIRRKRTGRPISSSGPVDSRLVPSRLTPDAPIFWRTSLLFPADEHVRAFVDREDRDTEWDDEGNEFLPVGQIDVALRTGERYALFTCAAVTSGMSDLFERSRGVWGRFEGILRASGGLVALFNGARSRGPLAYPILPDGRETVTFDYLDYVLEERDTYWHLDVDRYAATVHRAAGAAPRGEAGASGPDL